MKKVTAALIITAAFGVAASGCAHKSAPSGPVVTAEGSGQFTPTAKSGGGFRLPGFGSRAPKASGAGVAGLGVNSYLWRATLDTLAFMPLASADPYGGVIITDWYANPEKPDERFKATVYILDTRLRADGLNVNIHRQTKGPDGAWVNAATNGQTDTDIENAILTRARQLRLSNLNDRG
jgi:hypothetical protein